MFEDRLRLPFFLLLLVLPVAGCGALPHDGPSTRSVPREAAQSVLSPAAQGKGNYALVDLDYSVAEQIVSHPPVALIGLSPATSSAPSDLIGEGDVLSISVLEAGGSLFAKPADSSSSSTDQQSLPRVVVDDAGDASVPFGGEVHVAGLRPRDAAEAVRHALRRRAINPQVSVTVLESHANSVTVLGEVKSSGHFQIGAHNDRLLDALASAGGPTRPLGDLEVVVVRNGSSAYAPLPLLMSDPAQNIRLAPQDQVRVLYRPRKFTTFGAFARAGQDLIEDDNVTLAGALGRASGIDTNSANAASVLVFRFERPEVAEALGVRLKSAEKGVPIVYRLNLRNPESMFVANSFDMRADDILYVPRSDITEVQKFFNLVDSVTQVGYNVRVTSAIQ
jgi:polysaccharide export outer membrane protein